MSKHPKYPSLYALLKLASESENENSTKVGFPLPEMSAYAVFFPTEKLDDFMTNHFQEIETLFDSTEINGVDKFMFDQGERAQAIAALAVRSEKYIASGTESDEPRYLHLKKT